eukprot:12421680-Prorocentrum_lima.AAC.1
MVLKLAMKLPQVAPGGGGLPRACAHIPHGERHGLVHPSPLRCWHRVARCRLHARLRAGGE